MFLVSPVACTSLETDSAESVEELELEPFEDSGVSTNAFSDCPGGNICFYNGRNGTEGRCSWNEFDEDWSSGSAICSWANSANVQSVINNTRWRMEYFKQAHYVDRVGSTQPGVSGNLAGTYKLHSHRRQCGLLGC
jgi:hypothetical protein